MTSRNRADTTGSYIRHPPILPSREHSFASVSYYSQPEHSTPDQNRTNLIQVGMVNSPEAKHDTTSVLTLYRMLLRKVSLNLMASACLINAVIVDMFSDEGCSDLVDSRNVWDNTCALTKGFQSYRITLRGGDFQRLTAYNRHACVTPSTSCAEVISVGICFRATNQNGGSNAVSSYTFCG